MCLARGGSGFFRGIRRRGSSPSLAKTCICHLNALSVDTDRSIAHDQDGEKGTSAVVGDRRYSAGRKKGPRFFGSVDVDLRDFDPITRFIPDPSKLKAANRLLHKVLFCKFVDLLLLLLLRNIQAGLADERLQAGDLFGVRLIVRPSFITMHYSYINQTVSLSAGRTRRRSSPLFFCCQLAAASSGSP